MRRNALPEKQPRLDEAIERSREFRLALLGNGCHQFMREVPADGGSDLRDVLGCAEPIEPCDERGVEARRHPLRRRRRRRDHARRLAFVLRLDGILGYFFSEQRHAVGALDNVAADAFR